MNKTRERRASEVNTPTLSMAPSSLRLPEGLSDEPPICKDDKKSIKTHKTTGNRSNSVPNLHQSVLKEVAELRRKAIAAQKRLDESLSINEKARAKLTLDERILVSGFPLKAQQWLLAKVREADLMNEGAARMKIVVYIEAALNLPLETMVPSPFSLGIKELLEERQKMDSKMFGQQYLKDEIIATLARIITADSGSYIAFSGPPGIGKTMAARKLIADTLQLPFFQIACGGLHDPALLLGHSSTYLGAKPGQIAQFAEQAKDKRAVLVLDEIDKIASDAIWGVLTHMLDKTQNRHFHDHYFGNQIAIDLSKWIFVVTFNDIQKVNPIVKDRMRIIHMPDYTTAEKESITRHHLLPNALTEFHLLGLLQCTPEHEMNAIVQYLVQRGTQSHQTGMRGIKLACESLAVRWLIQAQVRDQTCVDLKLDPAALSADDECGNGMAFSHARVQSLFRPEDAFLNRSQNTYLDFYA